MDEEFEPQEPFNQFPARQGNGNIQVQDINDLAESMRVLNDDSLEDNSNMSKIDMRTRLHPNEIEGILGVDTLVSMGVLTQRCLDFTRQKKRLAVSERGLGRQELVSLSLGKREQEAVQQQSAFQKIGGMFKK